MFQVLLCPYGYKTCGWQVKLCDPIKHVPRVSVLHITLGSCGVSTCRNRRRMKKNEKTIECTIFNLKFECRTQIIRKNIWHTN